MISRIFGGYTPVAFICLAFLLMICSGLAIQTARSKLQRIGIRTPQAVSVFSLFRQMNQYIKLARREGWNPILGWLPLPLQITAVVLFFRGIYLIKVFKTH
jgi:hypothetical protein